MTHVTEPERAAFRAFLEEPLGLVDVAREHTTVPYTYWDYTKLRFPKNEGMRIDFQLYSPHWPSGLWAPKLTVKSARARAPQTTPR